MPTRPIFARPRNVCLLLAATFAAGCRGAGADPPDVAWSAPAPLPAGAGFGRYHGVADVEAGAGGALHALFVDDGDGDGWMDRVLYAAFDGRAWSPPSPLTAAPRPVAAARLAVDGASGEVYALWVAGEGPAEAGGQPRFTEVAYRVNRRGGWSAAASLYRAPAGAALAVPALAATGGRGRIDVVHATAEGAFAHATAAGGAWTTRAAGPDGAGPSLVLGSDGALALASTGSGMSPGLGRRAALADPWVRLFRGGRWMEPMRVHPAPAQASHAAQVAWDVGGAVHAVWLEADPGELVPTHLLHSHASADGAWGAPRELALEVPGGAFYSPRLAADGRGALHLVFTRFREEVSGPRHFHQVWRDGRWSPPREISGPRESGGGAIETATGEGGTLHALWLDGEGRYVHASLPPSGSAK